MQATETWKNSEEINLSMCFPQNSSSSGSLPLTLYLGKQNQLQEGGIERTVGNRCKEGKATSVKRSKLHAMNDWTYFVFKVHPSFKQFGLRLKIVMLIWTKKLYKAK